MSRCRSTGNRRFRSKLNNKSAGAILTGDQIIGARHDRPPPHRAIESRSSRPSRSRRAKRRARSECPTGKPRSHHKRTNHVVSIPTFARRAGLADDDRSFATARKLLTDGNGPPVVSVDAKPGVLLADEQTWQRDNKWAAYLAGLPERERDKCTKAALRIVGDAKYVTLLYTRFCRHSLRFQMTFERWLQRRQRNRDRIRNRTPRKPRQKGGHGR